MRGSSSFAQFKPRAVVRTEGGKLVFKSLGGKAQFWIDGKLAAEKTTADAEAFEVPVAPGDGDHTVSVLLEFPAGAHAGLGGVVTVEYTCWRRLPTGQYPGYHPFMARGSTINISLTASQMRFVRDRLASGGYSSASELIRESLRVAFGAQATKPARRKRKAGSGANLVAGYRVMAAHDRKLAREWTQLQDPWPEK